MIKHLLALVAVAFLAAAANAQNKSIYTDLDDTKCKTVELTDDEGGSYKGECKGTAGYKLHVIEGDLRQTITVVDPKSKEHPLRFWEHFGVFSAVGPKAEWRLKGKTPVALIVRLNVSENPEDASKTTSYLVVAKITPDFACVTDMIKPSRTQNADARKAADKAANIACKIAESTIVPDRINPDSKLPPAVRSEPRLPIGR
jgi:hypothetical protein